MSGLGDDEEPPYFFWKVILQLRLPSCILVCVRSPMDALKIFQVFGHDGFHRVLRRVNVEFNFFGVQDESHSYGTIRRRDTGEA